MPVSLFVILSGMTSYLLNLQQGGVYNTAEYQKNDDAYSIAVVVYMLVVTHEFDVAVYLMSA